MMKIAILFVINAALVSATHKEKAEAPAGVKYYHSLDLGKNDLRRDSAYPYQVPPAELKVE